MTTSINVEMTVGILAPIFSCSQFIPQMLKAYRTKSVKDLSIHTIWMIIITQILWFIHAYYVSDIPLLITATINFFINCIILYFCLNYKKQYKNK